MLQGTLTNFTDVLGDDGDEIANSQPMSLPLSNETETGQPLLQKSVNMNDGNERPAKGTGQYGDFRSIEEVDQKYRDVFSYPYFNLVQSRVIDDALYSDKSMVVCAPTGSGKTVVFEMAIVQLLMELDEKKYTGDFKIIYMAPVKALCTERLSEWYPKFTRLGLMCIEVTGDTNVDFSQLKPYRIIITTPEKWDMLTRRWRDHRGLVEVIKLFLIDEVHILNDDTRGPVLEAVVSRMKTIESSCQSAHRIEQLQKQYQATTDLVDLTLPVTVPPRIRFVAVSATISNPEDVATWLGSRDKPAVYYKFGDECRPVKLKRIVEGYPCSEGTSIFKFDIILNYKLWPVIQKYHDGKPTLIFCNTRKSVALTAETLSRELTISFTPEQKAKLTVLAAKIKNKKLQALVLSGVGCHHAGLLYEERLHIEEAFRNRDLPILITTTTLAMGVNLPAHLVIVKNTQQYVNGAYQEYSISTVLQMVGRAGRPQFDTEATAVIMTRLADKPRYQALVGGSEPLQSYLHKRLAENLNSEAALRTVCDVAQCVQWLRSTFLSVRAAKDPRRYLGLPQNAPPDLITKKIEELCVKAMNGLATAGLITMDEACCIESTEAGRLMSVFYLDLETMKQIKKIEGSETLERLLSVVCESHELADMHLRVDERRTLNTLNRNNASATIRFPMKGKISSRQMKLNCIIQAVLGCLPIPDPSLNQEAMKVMRIADRVCKCMVAYVTRPDLVSTQPTFFSAVVNALILAKCIVAHLWENSPYVSKQLKGIGPTFSTLLATAGKVNFTLLEESHPRDLERIMNKGAPAGNLLRKQVSLLPKYQLTATPIDEKRVSIQLMLLNQHHLAENRDQLTAGDSHKCYIVVGDSENNLLLFTSFKDNDLISVYDGILTYEITRKHTFEHKIIIHCISSDWVGIDKQCEYVFKGLEPVYSRGEVFNMNKIPETPVRKAYKKQTTITDVYKERKRKNTDVEVTQSKEKKKRENDIIEKFKDLKNSFEITSRELKKDLQKSAAISDKALAEISQQLYEDIAVDTFAKTLAPIPGAYVTQTETNHCDPVSKENKNDSQFDNFNMDTDLDEEDNFVVDERINSILNEIEKEINTDNNNKSAQYLQPIPQITGLQKPVKNDTIQSSFFAQPSRKNVIVGTKRYSKLDDFKYATSKRRNASTKSNYSFIDVLSKTNSNEDNNIAPEIENSFSETIKTHVQKFLQKTNKTTADNTEIENILNYNKEPENKKEISKELAATPTNTDDLIIDLPAICVNDKESDAKVLEISENDLNFQKNKEVPNDKKDVKQNMISDSRSTRKTCDMSVTNSSPQRGTIGCKDRQLDINTNNHVSNKQEEVLENIEKEMREKAKDPKIQNSKGNYKLMDNRNKPDKSAEGKELVHKSRDNVQQISQPAKVNKLFQSLNFLQPWSLPNIDSSFPYSDSTNQSLMPLNSRFVQSRKIVNSPVSEDMLIPVVSNITPANSKVIDLQTPFYTVTDYNPSNNNVPCTDVITVNPNSAPNRHDEGKQYQSENRETNEQNSKYTNKYSFSATKIDVSTKITPKHHIQIVRKLKLDLDVTEIVSESNPMTEQENVEQMNTGLENRQTGSIVCETRPHFSDLVPIKQSENTDTRLMKDILKSGENPTYEHQQGSIIARHDLTILDKVLQPIAPVENSSSKSHPNNLGQTNSKQTEDTQKYDSNKDDKVGDGKIGNVLKKYSFILRKNNNNNNIRQLSQDTVPNVTRRKVKRPFRISDIHTSDIQLPENIVTNDTKRRPTTDAILNRIENLEITNVEHTDESNTSKADDIAQTNPNQNIYENYPMRLSPIPEVSQVETADEFDIDQSMLNPKTLLQQCFPQEQEHDIIIPPPAEFCSEGVYSPVKFQDDPSSLTQYYSQQSEDVPSDSSMNIVTDNYVLTPSKEIETWTLSRDNEDAGGCRVDHPPATHPDRCHSLKSYTIMRKNFVNQKSSNNNKREQNLRKFKFMHKKKLKM